MEQKVTLSDLTASILDAEDVVKIVVRHHPSLQEPVELDAGEAEIKPLMAAESDYVLLDLVKADKTKQVVVDLPTFNTVFRDDPYRALMNARPVKVARASSGTRSNAGELAKIREWATANGYEVNAKGRIKQDIVDAYNAANPAA